MVYELAHIVQQRLPWIWDGVEAVNAALFTAKVQGKMSRLKDACVSEARIVGVEDAERLAEFFARQPKESFRWFQPHGFDVETLRKLLRRKSYIMYVMDENDGEIVGYAFLRCFFNGKCFLGKMVDAEHQGKGICTKLCAVGMEIADALGLRMFESINRENVGSMRASEKACDVVVVRELEGGDVLIEDRKKRGC